MKRYFGHEGKDRICCNCKHNIRELARKLPIRNYCEIDRHYIGYIDCFDCWCKHWAKEESQVK